MKNTTLNQHPNNAGSAQLTKVAAKVTFHNNR